MTSGFDWSWALGVGLIAFAFGIACGIGIGYLIPGAGRRTQELQEKLRQLQQEFDTYREEVGQHFLTTSQLVQKMTESYRDVYEHLATGSQSLCSNPVNPPRLDIPEHPTLESAADNPDVKPGSERRYSPDDTTDSEDTGGDDFLGDAPRVPTLDAEQSPETPTPRTPSL